MKKRVLAVNDYYLPGFRGGTIYSLANIVARLDDRYDFWIITKDRDVTETEPYSGIPRNQWTRVGGAMVYYAAPARLDMMTLRALVRDVNPDLLFVLSPFSRTSVRLLLLRRMGLLLDRPVLVAPEGEFALGALLQKARKKRAFLATAAAAGLYANVGWRATSTLETDDIRRVAGADAHVFLAPCLPAATSALVDGSTRQLRKQRGHVDFVYLSRITPKKNLLFALERLGEVRREMRFDILGPIEDKVYWADCVAYARNHCPHVRLQHFGDVPHERVAAELASRHFLLLPSLGENFGYVILEALACGRPVLLSNRTPWRDLERHAAGWDLDLDDPVAWRRTIERCIDMDDAEYQRMTDGASAYAQVAIDAPAIEAAVAAAFEGTMAITGTDG